MRNACVALLVFSLSGSSVFAQAVPAAASARPVQDAVHRAAVGLAAQVAQNQDKRIPPGYLWTGIGLLAGAGLYFLGAALYDPCEGLSGCESSFSGRTWAQGFVLAGAGAAVLIIGNSKRQVTPALLPAPRGIAVGGRLSF